MVRMSRAVKTVKRADCLRTVFARLHALVGLITEWSKLIVPTRTTSSVWRALSSGRVLAQRAMKPVRQIR